MRGALYLLFWGDLHYGVRWGGRFIWDSGRREAIFTSCSSLQSDCRWVLVLGLLWFCLTESFVVSYIRDYGLVLCILLGVAILHPRIRVYVMLCVSGSGALPAFCTHRSGELFEVSVAPQGHRYFLLVSSR